jgi:hypothetical protein
MNQDPFIALCEKLQLDYYKVAGTIDRCDNTLQLAKILDISRQDADALWDAYWIQYNDK